MEDTVRQCMTEAKFICYSIVSYIVATLKMKPKKNMILIHISVIVCMHKYHSIPCMHV